MTLDLAVHLLARFLHISSVILFLGGIVYARLVVAPSLKVLPESMQSQVRDVTREGFRNTLYVLLAVIIGSGLYNFFSFSGPKHTQSYQMWFGIKMLLVAHVLATSILWSTASGPEATGGNRRLTSIAISGLVIVAISAYLRSLTQRGL